MGTACGSHMHRAALLCVTLLAMIGLSGCIGDGTDYDWLQDDPRWVRFDVQWTNNGAEAATAGTIVLDLCPTLAPQHVDNFLAHADDGNYTGALFHRIIDGFMIQGGDFDDSDGSGGYAARWYGLGDPVDQNTWTVPDEAHNDLDHLPGILSMAKTSQPNTGGSQFFIVDHGSAPRHLDGVHTVFGRTSDSNSLLVVDSISGVETGSNDRPVHDVSVTFVVTGPILDNERAGRACQSVTP